MPIDINLEINGLPIPGGMLLSESTLAKGRIRKASLLVSLQMWPLTQGGDDVYWAKNPSFSFFHGVVSAAPKLRVTQASGLSSDFLNSTSAFLFFNNGRLRVVIAQVVGSYIKAQGFTGDFRSAAEAVLGQPESSPVVDVPFRMARSKSFTRAEKVNRPFALNCTWSDGAASVVSQLGAGGRTALVKWERRL